MRRRTRRGAPECNLSYPGTNIRQHQSIIKLELRGKLAFVVNELIPTSSKLRDQYQLLCSFGEILLCESFSHVFQSVVSTSSSSVLQTTSTGNWKLVRRATYPSRLDLIHVERQEKLWDSFQANPILVQMEASHSILKHNQISSVILWWAVPVFYDLSQRITESQKHIKSESCCHWAALGRAGAGPVPDGLVDRQRVLSDREEVGHDIEVTVPQTLSCVQVTGCMQWEADWGEPG